MKRNIYILFVAFILQVQPSIAQNKHAFIPANLVQLGEAQVKSGQIMITPDILIFSDNGQLLSQSQMSLMANPDYRPVFYANKKGKIKALVFEKISDNIVLVEQNPEAQFEEGENALDFITTDLEGTNIKLSELKGKVVVLNFWFIRCNPCIQEMPSLNALQKEYADKDVEFIAVTFDKKELVQQFLEEQEFTYRIAPDANDVISIYNTNSFPTNIVINKNGEIILKEIGYRTNIKEVLVASIDKALN